MTLKSDKLISIIRDKKFTPLIVIAIANLLLLSAFIFIGLRLYDTYNQVVSLTDSIEADELTMQLVKKNSDIFGDQIDAYNTTLNSLIPDEEGYFSVISALESLSERSGVSIDSYSINLESTTQEKLSLDVVVNAEPEQLKKFIANYQYISGRLMVNEGLSFDPSNPTALVFSLNLYHKAFNKRSSDSSAKRVPRVSQKDIQLVQEIINTQTTNQ